jgi:hypothetical protein
MLLLKDSKPTRWLILFYREDEGVEVYRFEPTDMKRCRNQNYPDVTELIEVIRAVVRPDLLSSEFTKCDPFGKIT